MTQRSQRPPAMLIAGSSLLALIILVAILGPLLLGDHAEQLTADVRQGPAAAHWLGTDAFGRDILARTLVATRLTLLMALASTLIASIVGIGFGALAALGSLRTRQLGARLVDLLVSYPPIIIAIAIIAIFNPGKVSVAVGVGVALVPQFARLANKLTAVVLTKDYISLARLLGVPGGRLALRHVLPNIAAPLLVLVSVVFATSIIALSGLSFIGLGVQQPDYDWGQLLAAGLRDMYQAPAAVFGPSIAILITGLAAGLLGDGFDAYFQPRSGARTRRASSAPLAGKTSEDTYEEMSCSDVVKVRQLKIGAGEDVDDIPLVRGISFHIRAGEIVGLVGESGSGKSLTAMATARLASPQLVWSAATLNVAGASLADPDIVPPKHIATDLGVVFQDPSSCFNPAMRLGAQLTEVARVHRGLAKKQAWDEALNRLAEVRISNPRLRMRQYPHELSGGMRQRAMIAMALLSEPKLLIADEPTTALDVTVQADVLRLMKQLTTSHDMAMLLISHDINVVATMCDRIYVMYAGSIVEEVTTEDLRSGHVMHPYTQALLAAALDSQTDVTQPLQALHGRPPEPADYIRGCAFAARCPLVHETCLTVAPALQRHGDGEVSCHAMAPATQETMSR
ncbi:oligopeptide/dipeptide ABC transporter, ATP-binding protein, C-terminal domain-containing protein [Actinokineospora alba]|uniref:Oligopeptide/dipeptide ABC transporter, ATP-binding protein, C-terminal domain-containing protein n=1 Tax=Actinokineospora alba TaxID=504798 RepID=A0A1H0L5M6_9PSEU|nr:dipeptide/oligopeptide/nickel ABC transporter permease/ATP-binding protein [Actinokineospora alba]TDP67211.1 oligopeptide/dipeptide ABC transporter ATP-binding protein [Actinokineospora alba]SDJ04368.1 oligopeptide/dipeptide ABC transporter, ATP-binding protein, C-terminal domain-containing protein [Actinokineospora alba]SDO63517.1 oligopeptide/dipeptide ABC transporter, ATP-binding protein, C-terminal domain-containing protein [Actinokineospora alba]